MAFPLQRRLTPDGCWAGSAKTRDAFGAAIRTLGGYGYVQDFPLERIARDVRVCQIYDGTSDVQKMIITRALRSNTA